MLVGGLRVFVPNFAVLLSSPGMLLRLLFLAKLVMMAA
jgi:hypothetical protein